MVIVRAGTQIELTFFQVTRIRLDINYHIDWI